MILKISNEYIYYEKSKIFDFYRKIVFDYSKLYNRTRKIFNAGKEGEGINFGQSPHLHAISSFLTRDFESSKILEFSLTTFSKVKLELSKIFRVDLKNQL